MFFWDTVYVTIHQRYRQTHERMDEQTNSHSNTALGTEVLPLLRAVKGDRAWRLSNVIFTADGAEIPDGSADQRKTWLGKADKRCTSLRQVSSWL